MIKSSDSNSNKKQKDVSSNSNNNYLIFFVFRKLDLISTKDKINYQNSSPLKKFDCIVIWTESCLSARFMLWYWKCKPIFYPWRFIPHFKIVPNWIEQTKNDSKQVKGQSDFLGFWSDTSSFVQVILFKSYIQSSCKIGYSNVYSAKLKIRLK